MECTERAAAYWARLFPGKRTSLAETDPEFAGRFASFAFDEVVNSDGMDDRTRFLAILSALLGCQGVELFQEMVPAARNGGMTPVEVKEIVYQAAAYLGLGRVYPFLAAANRALAAAGAALPLEGQETTDLETRLEAGNQAQVDIFGEGMRGFQDSGPEESRRINRWLAANCFGDYYTRKGLDLRRRELVTFCLLAVLGGCEPQLVSHAAGNLRVGNGKETLISAICQCLPYIGYPRSLNALRCVQQAAEQARREEPEQKEEET